jgi:asparagine N-glycosylation enzyme membrane subunit Stt3
VVQDFALRIVLVVAGLLALAFSIANGFSNGWQLDIVNLITIFAAIVLIVVGIFVKDIMRRK